MGVRYGSTRGGPYVWIVVLRKVVIRTYGSGTDPNVWIGTVYQRVVARILYSAVLLATSLGTSGLGDVAGEVLLGLDLFLVSPCSKTPSSQYRCFGFGHG